MKRKKGFYRLLSILMVAVMLLSTGATALAEDDGFTDSGITGSTDSTGSTGNTDSTGSTDSTDNTDSTGSDVESGETSGETPDETSGETPDETPEEFDAARPFTFSMLADISFYNMEMEDADIPIENFELEGVNEDHSTPCTLHFKKDEDGKPITTIPGGQLKEKVPLTVVNDAEVPVEHVYVKAHVGNTQVYYVGKLTIYDENGKNSNDYIYYTTDKHITNKTVYAVLKKDEKIKLVYDHGNYCDVEYVVIPDPFSNEPTSDDEGLTEDAVFGKDRALKVKKGRLLGVEVTIPRGYTANVFAYSDQSVKVFPALGKMMEYEKIGQNTITRKSGSPERMQLTESFNLDNVGSAAVITVHYQKAKDLKFDASLWCTTAYAQGRFFVKDASGNDVYQSAGWSVPITSPKFKWEIESIENFGATWEMDQLEINGEAIRVPMTSLANTEPKTEKTTLSSGTEVTLTVQSLHASSPNRRHYTFAFDKCYENLTVSGGNLVGNEHREFAVNTLIGTEDAQYWHTTNKWQPLAQDTLIDRKNAEYVWDNPLRFKLAEGYQNMDVTFTTKERVPLQKNGTVEDNTQGDYIDYLIPNNTIGADTKGDYTKVSYADWKPDEDGYYYLRATEKLDKFMTANHPQGVILLFFEGDPMKAAIDYQDGAGDGETAPLKDHISNMPASRMAASLATTSSTMLPLWYPI